MVTKRKIALGLALLGALIGLTLLGSNAAWPVQARPLSQAHDQVVLYFFWGDGCPHCQAAKPFLQDLAGRFPELDIREYEVWHSDENLELFQRVAAALGTQPRAVPTFFLGEQSWVGFSDALKPQIEAAVIACLETGCPDPAADVVTVVTVEEPPSAVQPEGEPASSTLALPILGTVDLAGQSLVLSTAIIGFVDGFNPCSLWVLSVLIGLTLHTGSRKRVFLVGLTFLAVSALVYVLFIVGLFTLLTLTGFLAWIQAAVSLLALVFAAVNIKDYFWYKEGLSFTISDKRKPGVYKRMRKVAKSQGSIWGLLGATVALGIGVSLVEFSCTAGFPVLWTNLLAAQNVTWVVFALLLTLYMLIYYVDELAIFLVAVFTLRASRLEEKHGRVLKLVSGTLMFTLAAVMLIRPALMNNVLSSLILFVAAFGAAMLILLLHRRVLPHFGIRIGTEFELSHAGRRRGR